MEKFARENHQTVELALYSKMGEVINKAENRWTAGAGDIDYRNKQIEMLR